MREATVTGPQILSTEPDSPYEVIEGRIVTLPPKGVPAVLTVANLQGWLGPFVRENRLGSIVSGMRFILDPRRKVHRRPDLAFVS